MKQTLLRSEAEALLTQDCRWTVQYCGEDGPPRCAGTGFSGFPAGVLSHVPTPAAARKLARGHRSKTYFYVRLDGDQGGPLLRFEEG